MIPRLAAVAGVSLVVALLLYLPATTPTITTRFGGVDGGELAATALGGGVPHPSGYPTYMLLARTALRIFPGEPAGGLAYLSAVSAALAVALTAALVMLVVMPANRTIPSVGDLAAGAYAALVLAIGPRFWSQAIIPEVYATFMFWLSLSALLGLAWLRSRRDALLWAAGLCLGLGTGAHLTILALGPAALLAGWAMPDRRRLLGWPLAGAMIGFLCGTAVYGLLPGWGARGALPTWGDQQTLAGLWAHISGAEYRYLAGAVPWGQRIGRLSFAARDLLTQPGPAGLALAALLGIAYCWEHNRPAMLGLAVVALSSLVFAISYGGADGTVYLLPWTWAWSIWAGFGVKAGLELLQRSRSPRLATSIVVLALIGILAWSGLNRQTELTLRADTSTRDAATAELSRLPANAVYVTSDDAETFGAWYVQHVLGVRPDVLVVDTRLMVREWYRAQLRDVLQAGDGGSICAAVTAGDRPVHRAAGDVDTPASELLQQACRRTEP